MSSASVVRTELERLKRLLAESEATVHALLSGQIDAVVDSASNTPILLSKAQSALRESEERYRQIVESTTEGIVKVDAAANITFANQRFAEMVGCTLSEVIGKSLFSFMDAEARADAIEIHQRVKDGAQETTDASLRRKDGTAVAVSMAGTRILDVDGQFVGALKLIRDVTAQKSLLAQLLVSDRMASVGTLAAGVAHEINNPMTVVVANLDFLTDTLKREPELKSALDDAREAADRVRLIVRDLKMFSRTPEDEERTAPVDVQATIKSSLRMAWNEIRHRARLVEEYGHDVPLVLANEGRLGQVFLNLLVNAAQALPPGAIGQNEIKVTTRRDCDRVCVEVTDNGGGIPAEIIGRVFDVFFTTKPVGVGTGLGLAISQRIVTDLGGELRVMSVVGEGTTFTVSLPLAHAAAQLSPPILVKREPDAVRGRVLLIDDEESILRSVRRILSAEHDVVMTTSGEDALALLAAGETFDVILCDLMMPTMNGMEVHRRLNVLAPLQAARMVFVTGGAFTAEAQDFLAFVDRAHVDKPFDPRSLRLAVDGFLRKARALAPPPKPVDPRERRGAMKSIA